jgi:hypothetical protein
VRLPGRLVFCLCILACLLACSFAPLLVCLLACSLVCLSAHSPACLLVYLSACLCVCYLLGCMCAVCLSVRSFIRPLVYLFCCPSASGVIYPSFACLSVCSFSKLYLSMKSSTCQQHVAAECAFYNARLVSSHGSFDLWPPAQGHPNAQPCVVYTWSTAQRPAMCCVHMVEGTMRARLPAPMCSQTQGGQHTTYDVVPVPHTASQRMRVANTSMMCNAAHTAPG